MSATTAMRIECPSMPMQRCGENDVSLRRLQAPAPRCRGTRGRRSGLYRVLLGVGGDLRMGGEPHARPRLCVADQLLDDPDARAVADEMRMRGQLEDAAFVVGHVKIAAAAV